MKGRRVELARRSPPSLAVDIGREKERRGRPELERRDEKRSLLRRRMMWLREKELVDLLLFLSSSPEV